jgi:hypothetical protein
VQGTLATSYDVRTCGHIYAAVRKDVLLADQTSIEILRAARDGRQYDLGALVVASVEVICDLDERIAQYEEQNPGSALANIRWRRMALPERRAALEAAKAHKAKNGRQG